MIKAVLFDYCGVLTEGGKTGSIRAIVAELTGRQVSEIEVADLHDSLVCGQISETEYFVEINRRYPSDQPATQESFIAHSDIYVRCQPIYQFAARLRQKGLRTAIVSNMYSFAAAKLRAEGAYESFDPVILSHQERVAKPDRAIFEIALKKLDLPAHEVLYVDDQERFRPVVQAVGMPFIVARSPQQIIDDTKAILRAENNLILE